MSYALKNEGHRVVARSKSKETAHRSSRKKKHAGTRVVMTTTPTTMERRTLNGSLGLDVFTLKTKGGEFYRVSEVESGVFQLFAWAPREFERKWYKIGEARSLKRVAASLAGMHSFDVWDEKSQELLRRWRPEEFGRWGNRTGSLNMAKLSARGRTELARVSREKETPEDTLTSWEKTTVTLMSDGSILEKRDVKFRSDNRRHSYGWSVRGKVKAGLTPRQFADIYAKRGFEVENVSSFSGDVAVRTEKAAAASKKARTKRAEKVEISRREEAVRSGPGFYVTNGTTGTARAAELGPFATIDEATSAAWDKLRGFMDMKLTYLLPVQVVEASSREAAEMGDGHVWWTNGKMRGAPVPEGQLAFAV